MSEERWLPVPGYEGHYEVSDLGRMRSFKWGRVRLLNPTLMNGYPTALLCMPGKKKVRRPLHHLILMTFVGPRPEGMVSRHLNGNSKDSRLVNLAWGTQSENVFDAVRHGTQFQISKTCCPRGHPYDDRFYGPFKVARRVGGQPRFLLPDLSNRCSRKVPPPATGVRYGLSQPFHLTLHDRSRDPAPPPFPT